MKKNVLTALLFECIGGFFLYYSLPLGLGTLKFIGPGFTSTVVSVALMITGVIVFFISDDR
tara:strand:+ start:3226 stop:3408 length:183 start_codon:yes stop_codon:yes gene_type:complete